MADEMNTTHERRPNVSVPSEDVAAMQAFLRFVEPRLALIATRTRALASGPLLQRLVAEESTRSAERSHALRRAAVFDGEWEPYLESMRQEGEEYARAGVSFSAWFELIRIYRIVVSEQITADLAENRQHDLSDALTISRGFHALMSLAIEQICEGYVAAKQRELTSSEELHRAMFDNSPLPMWTFDRSTLRFLTVNEAAVRDYGYSREEFASMTLADIRPHQDLAALQADVASAYGLSERRTWRHRKKDGSIINVDVRANDFTLQGTTVRLVLIKKPMHPACSRRCGCSSSTINRMYVRSRRGFCVMQDALLSRHRRRTKHGNFAYDTKKQSMWPSLTSCCPTAEVMS